MIKMRHFDIRGRPITAEQWAIAFEYGPHTIRHTETGRFVISTVWLGIDHSFGEGKPLIFETMVFKRRDWKAQKLNELDVARYSTAEQAIKGHDRMVRKWAHKI